MPPSVAPLLALVAAMLGQAADGALAGLICADPGDWNADAPFELNGQMTKCGAVTDMYLTAFKDKTSFTEQDCKTIILQPDRDLKFGLFYLGYTCCGTGKAANSCGWPFGTNPCAEPEDFMNVLAGGYHCLGDEDITDKTQCVNAGGEKAWDEAASEKCDVGRGGRTESQQLSACTQLGGTWKQSMCVDFMTTFAREVDPTSSCDSKVKWPDTGMSKAVTIHWMAGMCCRRPSTQCGEFNTNPCENAQDFTPSKTYDEKGNLCSNLALHMSSATGQANFCKMTVDECATKPRDYGGMTVAAVFDMFASKCCGGGASNGACSSGCVTTTPASSSHAQHMCGASAATIVAVCAALAIMIARNGWAGAE